MDVKAKVTNQSLLHSQWRNTYCCCGYLISAPMADSLLDSEDYFTAQWKSFGFDSCNKSQLIMLIT